MSNVSQQQIFFLSVWKLESVWACAEEETIGKKEPDFIIWSFVVLWLQFDTEVCVDVEMKPGGVGHWCEQQKLWQMLI